MKFQSRPSFFFSFSFDLGQGRAGTKKETEVRRRHFHWSFLLCQASEIRMEPRSVLSTWPLSITRPDSDLSTNTLTAAGPPAIPALWQSYSRAGMPSRTLSALQIYCLISLYIKKKNFKLTLSLTTLYGLLFPELPGHWETKSEIVVSSGESPWQRFYHFFLLIYQHPETFLKPQSQADDVSNSTLIFFSYLPTLWETLWAYTVHG